VQNKIKDSNDLFRRLLLNPCKVMSKKPEHWLFTDWSLYMSEFKIFTSYEDMKLITSRKIWSTFRWIIGQIRQGEITNWFNLDNIENEIKDYAKQHDLKIKGLKITLNDLKKTGWSYTNKETALIEAEEKNKYFQEKDSKQRIRIIE
jgi:hypothetical protein